MRMNVQSRSLNDENFSHWCRRVWLMVIRLLYWVKSTLMLRWPHTTTTTIQGPFTTITLTKKKLKLSLRLLSYDDHSTMTTQVRRSPYWKKTLIFLKTQKSLFTTIAELWRPPQIRPQNYKCTSMVKVKYLCCNLNSILVQVIGLRLSIAVWK